MRYDMSSTNGVRSMPVALHHVLDKRAHTCAYSTPPQIEREEWLGGSRYLTPPPRWLRRRAVAMLGGERLAYLRGALACSACVLPIHVSTYVLMMGVHSIMSPILLV
jgi:hypothetical protein